MSLNALQIVKGAASTVSTSLKDTAVAGTLADAWQGLVGDRVAAWRVANAAKIQLKLEAEVKNLGLSINAAKVPDRYAFSWFEQATKQDDPEIQDLFARLLLRAISGDEDASDQRLIEILGKMTPEDARSLDFIGFEAEPPRQGQVVPDLVFAENVLHKRLTELHGRDAWKTIEHLSALGIIERRTRIGRPSGITNISRSTVGGVPLPTRELNLEEGVSFTAIGWSLYNSVKPAEAR